MAAIRAQLRNPPISEALIDIRIVGTEPSQESLESLRNRLHSRYPRWDERRAFSATVTPSRGSVEGSDRGFFGYFLHSEDGKTTVQLKKNGFTLNRLAPYLSGDRLVAEALAVWQLYVAAVKADAVSRLAIRYINRLDLPLADRDELTRFVLSPPPLPEGVPHRVTDFMTRVVLVDTSSSTTTIVTQALNRAQGTPVPFILDLDTFKTDTLPVDAARRHPHLQTLRLAAKRAFLGSLTEEAVNLYA